jgi:hypothetical protein
MKAFWRQLVFRKSNRRPRQKAGSRAAGTSNALGLFAAVGELHRDKAQQNRSGVYPAIGLLSSKRSLDSVYRRSVQELGSILFLVRTKRSDNGRWYS